MILKIVDKSYINYRLYCREHNLKASSFSTLKKFMECANGK